MIDPHALELVKGVSSLGSLPDIYQRISQVVNNPRSTAKDIGKITSEDPGLTGRLLRLVNSAFFGFPSKIETVSRAVMIVGTDQLRDLSLATSVVEMFDKVPQEIVDMNSFWKHSIACGVCARVIAGLRREQNVERFFVAGLLHDIGSMILYIKKPDESIQMIQKAKNEKKNLHVVEKEVLGFDHAQIGGALLSEWRLPLTLQTAVNYHHAPHKTTNYRLEVYLVHVAEMVVNALDLGSSGETFVPSLDYQALDFLKLGPEQLTNMMIEIDKQYQDVIKIILKEN